MIKQRLAIRNARPEDIPAITRIYNQGIEDRIATFETEPRTAADIERLLADRDGHYPAIVVERGGEVVAWASAGTVPWSVGKSNSTGCAGTS